MGPGGPGFELPLPAVAAAAAAAGAAGVIAFQAWRRSQYAVLGTPPTSASGPVTPGVVYLVGAGPGGIGLITVRGAELVRIAEVLVMDELADPEFARLVSPGCEVHVVGKRGGKASSVPQTAINKLLVAAAGTGKVVVRLKGGDPLVFGRVYQEMVALRAAGLSFEIVPGVTSVLSAPAAAGIPVTDKELSKTFAVISGHAPGKLDWANLAQLDTLVILMGTRKLNEIVELLIEHDRPATTPIAIVSSANTPRQHVVKSTLGGVVAAVGDQVLSPAIIVIGAVAGLAE